MTKKNSNKKRSSGKRQRPATPFSWLCVLAILAVTIGMPYGVMALDEQQNADADLELIHSLGDLDSNYTVNNDTAVSFFSMNETGDANYALSNVGSADYPSNIQWIAFFDVASIDWNEVHRLKVVANSDSFDSFGIAFRDSPQPNVPEPLPGLSTTKNVFVNGSFESVQDFNVVERIQNAQGSEDYIGILICTTETNTDVPAGAMMDFSVEFYGLDEEPTVNYTDWLNTDWLMGAFGMILIVGSAFATPHLSVADVRKSTGKMFKRKPKSKKSKGGKK